MTLLWEISRKYKECAINIATIDDKVTVHIFTGKYKKKKTTFAHKDCKVIVAQLQQFLAA